MKGKKGDRGKKGYEKEKLAKIWESTTKVMNTARGTITAKAVRKEEKKEERQRKRTRKRRETSCKFQFPRLLQNMWKMETQGE